MPTPLQQIELDPQQGEKWEHIGGGTFYVLERNGRTVRIQQPPFGDSLTYSRWMTIRAFSRLAKRRIDS